MEGPAVIGHFFPPTAVIHVGQSVTWTVPQGLTAPITVTFPLTADMLKVSTPNMMMDSAKAPHLVLGPGIYTATAKSGSDFPDDGKASAGLLGAGQSFTLRFTKPGEYHYFNGFSTDMTGTVVVLPAEQK
jgi:plastocyanin